MHNLRLCAEPLMAEEMVMFQMGTDPAPSALPIAYHVVNGAEMALVETCK